MVSIIVPIFNSEQYLFACLESIRKQTFANIEVVMVNNGSTDRSKEICIEFAKDKRFKYCESANGIVVACKKGILEATGELITFVDTDDYIESDMISQMVRMQKEHDCDIVVSGYAKIEDGKVVAKKTYCEEVLTDEKLKLSKKKYFCFDETGHRQFYSSKWGKLFKRDILLLSLKYYNEIIVEDEDMSLVYPAILLANKIGLITGTLYNYVQRTDSVSHSFYGNFVDNQLIVINSILSALRDKESFSLDDEANIIYNRMLCLIQKARFFSTDKAIEFLENLYKIDTFKNLDLKRCDTTFSPKAKLADAFLNRNFDKCLTLINDCIII